MTNLKTIATTCLAISGLAMAQDGTIPSGSFPTPSSSSSSSVAAPRTGLYTGVTKGNAAADNTVDDYSRRPTLIGDREYVAGFGGADPRSAAFNFSPGSLNWFGAVTADVTTAPATLRLGVGSGTAWGGGVLLAIHRENVKPTAANNETTTYFEPSGFGFFGDFNLGSSDVYGQIGWNTGFPSTLAIETSVNNVPATGDETNNDNHTLSLMAGWKKDATTEGTHAFNVEGQYLMEMANNETVTPNVEATTSTISVMPSWAYILKMNSDYSVFIGANMVDQLISMEQGQTINLSLTPNFAFQKQLGKGFEGFSGFSVTALWEQNSDQPVDDASSSTMLTGGADVALGLRWVKDNFAVEGSMKETVLANGPYLIGGNAGQGFFYEFGLSLGI